MTILKKLLSALGLFSAAMVLIASPVLAKNHIHINGQLTAGAWEEKSGIQISPIYLDSPDASLNFLSLDEATRSGVIDVTETGSVNQLVVENQGRKPILLLAGEVVSGGKQDRIVGKDMILGPGKTRKINVFCVEHGRWTPSAEREKFKSSSMMADQSIRQSAQGRGGSSENQPAVWHEVAKAIDGYKVAAPTQNYQEIKKSEKFKDSEAVARYFIQSFAKDDAIAGFALAYNGDVQSMEYFASPNLLSKYRDKLIRSYVASGFKDLQESKAVDLDEVKDFANETLSKETHQYQTEDDVTIESSSDTIQSFELATPKLKTVHYARYVSEGPREPVKGNRYRPGND
jgi:hypothetical protein